VRRDFFRAAVFLLNVLAFAALSIALYTFGRSLSASSTFFALRSFLSSKTAFSILFFRLRLKTRFRSETRRAFLADFVIGMGPTLPETCYFGNLCILPWPYGILKAMISHLKGTVIYKDLKTLVLDCNGVGYKVSPTIDPLAKAVLGEVFELWTYTVVREDVLDLYGFASKEELDFFELLLSVSGIGPKSALSILSLASLPALQSAITTGDTTHLTKVSGIGKKNAEKIVLELKGKLKTEGFEGMGFKDEVDVIEALKALGYSHKDARDAIKDMPSELSVQEKIKAALKTLGN